MLRTQTMLMLTLKAANKGIETVRKRAVKAEARAAELEAFVRPFAEGPHDIECDVDRGPCTCVVDPARRALGLDSPSVGAEKKDFGQELERVGGPSVSSAMTNLTPAQGPKEAGPERDPDPELPDYSLPPDQRIDALRLVHEASEESRQRTSEAKHSDADLSAAHQAGIAVGRAEALRELPSFGAPRPNEQKPTREEVLAWSKEGAGDIPEDGILAGAPLPRPNEARLDPHLREVARKARERAARGDPHICGCEYETIVRRSDPRPETVLPHDPRALLDDLRRGSLTSEGGSVGQLISAHTAVCLIDVLVALTGSEGT